MKTSLALSSAIEKVVIIATLFSTAFMVYPEAALAASLQNEAQNSQALVFEVGHTKQKEALFAPKQLAYSDLLQNDPLVTKVKAYLESYNSPLAQYTDQIVVMPQWQRALAITFVESDFCRVASDNNCGSYGVRPGHPSWRKYPTALQGFEDVTKLLEKPTYKQRFTSCKKMMGVYVVPGTRRWLNGCNKVSDELVTMTSQAEQERLALFNGTNILAATNDSELVK